VSEVVDGTRFAGNKALGKDSKTNKKRCTQLDRCNICLSENKLELSEEKVSKVRETQELSKDEEIYPRGETQLKVDMHVTNSEQGIQAWPWRLVKPVRQ
jgi:hypothetical protein